MSLGKGCVDGANTFLRTFSLVSCETSKDIKHSFLSGSVGRGVWMGRGVCGCFGKGLVMQFVFTCTFVPGFIGSI